MRRVAGVLLVSIGALPPLALVGLGVWLYVTHMYTIGVAVDREP